MPWNALANNILTENRRRQELEVEKQSEYQQWRNELGSEIHVFVKRTNRLDVDDSDDRYQFYELTDKFAPRFQELRNRSEASNAPPEALIEIEELVELLDDTLPPASIGIVSLDPSPAERRRQKQRRKERKQRRKKKVQNEMDEIAEKIRSLNTCFEEPFY